MNLSDNTAVERDGPEPKVGLFYRWLPFMRWTPSDPAKLQAAEEELQALLKASWEQLPAAERSVYEGKAAADREKAAEAERSKAEQEAPSHCPHARSILAA